MSSHPEVIRVCSGVDIDSDLIDAAKRECDALKLNTAAPFEAFPPGEKCVKIIESVKQKARKVQSSSVIVLLPGTTTEYLRSPCIIIPINTDGLPTTVKTKPTTTTSNDGKVVTVNWDAGRAWDVLQDIRLAPVNKKGGTLLDLSVG